MNKLGVMTHTKTLSSTASTFLGYNKPVANPIIGVITYNMFTGQVRTCEVTVPFWGENEAPNKLDCAKELLERGFGQIRYNTVQYKSLV